MTFEFFPKERPELGDCWAVFWFLPCTGAHLLYMRDKKKGSFRLGLFLLWISSPFLLTPTPVLFRYWIYAVFIPIGVWIYDAMTLRRLFESKWGKKSSLRI